MSTPEPTAALEAVVEPVVATLGFELVYVEWVGRRLCVYLDHTQGVTLADCVRMTPIISNALDAAEADENETAVKQLLSAPYTLEVSSPGLDRPLRRRAHFSRFVGHKVTVQTTSPLEPDSRQRTFHGRIEAVQGDDDSSAVVVRSEEGHQHAIPLALIRRANLVYEG